MRYSNLFEEDLLVDHSDGANKDFLKRMSIQFANLIKKDCQSFLNQWNSIELYHGSRSTNKFTLIYKNKIRHDRRPSDSSKQHHNFYNNLFSKFGFATNRSNSIFCTGDLAMAKNYGEELVIFPIGNFNFLWSSKVKDMFNTFQDSWPNYYLDTDNYNGFQHLITDWDKIEHDIKQSYTDQNLSNAILSGNEVMISGTEYYAIDHLFYNKYLKQHLSFI